MSAMVLFAKTALVMLTLDPSTQRVASGSPTPQALPMAMALSVMGSPFAPRETPMVCMVKCLARSRTSGGMSSYFRLAVNSARVCV